MVCRVDARVAERDHSLNRRQRKDTQQMAL